MVLYTVWTRRECEQARKDYGNPCIIIYILDRTKVISRRCDDHDGEKGKSSYHSWRIPCFALGGRRKSLALPILRHLGER